jgi:SOS-response transcriptional repressor LexA
MDVGQFAELTDARPRGPDDQLSGGNLLFDVHEVECRRNIPLRQAETIIWPSHGIVRILPGMPVTRDQIVTFIYAAMDALGLETPAALSRACGIHPSTLSKFLKNPVSSDLGMKTIAKISDRSGLPFPKVSRIVQLPVAKPGQQRGSVDLQSTIPVQGGSQDLPIYGEDQLGSMAYDFRSPVPLGYAGRPVDLTSERAYAVRIRDDSMAPRFKAGELIYVDPTRPAKPGDDIVVRLKDGEGFVMRLVSRDLDGIRVDSYQPDGERNFPNEELAGLHVIVGVAVPR